MVGSISPDGARDEIRENALVAGNPVKTSSKFPVTAVTQLTGSAEGVLQQTAHLPIVQPTITAEIFDITGTPNGNIMTQTLVAAASATTFTTSGWFRIDVVSGTDALLSTGSYYIPFGTLT
jgi:hypothetical protein